MICILPLMMLNWLRSGNVCPATKDWCTIWRLCGCPPTAMVINGGIMINSCDYAGPKKGVYTPFLESSAVLSSAVPYSAVASSAAASYTRNTEYHVDHRARELGEEWRQKVIDEMGPLMRTSQLVTSVLKRLRKSRWGEVEEESHQSYL